MKKLSDFENIFIKLVKKYVKVYPDHSFKFYFDNHEVETIGISKNIIVAKYKNSEEVFKRIFSQGSLGLGEIYCEGLLEIKDEDYKYLLLLFVRLVFNLKLIFSLSLIDIVRILKAKYYRPFLPRKNQYENINSHYSLSDWFENEKDSNEFYMNWLNSKYVQYSCGWWNSETKTVNEAQENKFKHYIKRLGINKGSKGKTLLDLGCGWGGIMFFLAEKYGIKCYGLTLSIAQTEYIKEEIKKRKLNNLVSVETKNIHNISGKYDYIVSVGVMEHISDYDDLYKKTATALKENGRALFHTMFHKEYFYKTDSFILKYIFPGGAKPYLKKNIKIFKKYFEYVDLESLPLLSYPKTLNCWYKDFCKNEDKIRKLLREKSKCKDINFGIKVFKHYLMLAYCGMTEMGYVGNVLAYNN